MNLRLIVVASLLLAAPPPPAGAARAVDVVAVRPAEPAVTFAGARPDPSGRGMTLEYTLPHAAQVSLRLYSVAGRLIATVDAGAKDTGTHRASFAGRGPATGTYFAVLMVDGHRFTRTVLLH